MIKKSFLAGIAGAAFLLSFHTAHAQNNIPSIRMCTGLKGLNYHDVVGDEVRKQAKGRLDVILVTSKGSLDNYEKLGKDCDVAVMQSDAGNAAENQNSIEFGPPLYKEDWHLICNTDSGVDRITRLNSSTKLLLGDNGGGAEVTWMAFVKADPDRYGQVPHDPIGGLRAAGIVQLGQKAACMAVVTGLNSAGIKEISERAAESNNMRLIPSNDADILKLKDAKGHYVYTEEAIPSGTYRGLQPKSMFGSSVNTVAVTAMIVASSDYIDKHGNDYEKFLHAVNSALPNIKARVGSK